MAQCITSMLAWQIIDGMYPQINLIQKTWSRKTSHYDDMLDEFSSCLVLTFSAQFPVIGNKLLDMLSFLLVCDVVWMGLPA